MTEKFEAQLFFQQRQTSIGQLNLLFNPVGNLVSCVHTIQASKWTHIGILRDVFGSVPEEVLWVYNNIYF